MTDGAISAAGQTSTESSNKTADVHAKAERLQNSRVYAPFDGEVVTLFPTKHALGLKSDSGVELLIHVGRETVGLNGKHFTAHVKDGLRIKKGDLLLESDLDAIQKEGDDIVTPLIVSNTDDYSEIVSLVNGQVKAMTPVLEAK